MSVRREEEEEEQIYKQLSMTSLPKTTTTKTTLLRCSSTLPPPLQNTKLVQKFVQKFGPKILVQKIWSKNLLLLKPIFVPISAPLKEIYYYTLPLPPLTEIYVRANQ